MSQSPEILTQAGIHPTADQIELYAYHLPNSTLSNLMVFQIFFLLIFIIAITHYYNLLRKLLLL